MSRTPAILITGSARGIGRAMALHLAAPGTLLLLHYRNSAAEVRQVAGEAEKKGAQTELLQADLAEAQPREALMDAVAARSAHLTALINNVGSYAEVGLLEITPEQWRHTLEVTCNAVFHLTQRAVPLLRKGAPARVINLGDSGSDRIVARTAATPYHIAKLGVHVLTRSYAKLLAGEGITVNQISPGFLENSVGQPGSPIPAGREGRLGDLLPALDYLLSPQADFVTGTTITVAGGWNL